MKTQSDATQVIRGLAKLRSMIGISLALILLLTLSTTTAHAAATIVIGNGTPESCDIWQTVVQIQQAVADIDPGGTITFNCGPDPVTIWIGDIEIYKDLTIDGGGLITFTGGTGSGCALCVLGDASVQLIDLTVADAYSACDGALYNTGALTLRHVTVARNTTDHGCSGGGIGNAGTLIIEDSLIVENYTWCDLVQCGWGGGISNGGTMRITNSTISGNSAALYGGGIWNSGNATIENTTIAGNHSGCTSEYDETGEPYQICYPGGGIRNLGTMSIINSTISGNSTGTAAAVNGGGISNEGTLFLQNTTVTDNTAPSDAGLANGNLAMLQNSILAGNLDTNGQPSDCGGTLTGQGYNLIGSTSGCTIAGDTTGNLVNVDPLLGPLQDNGGATFTHTLLSASPALDAGNPLTPGSGGTACEATDQRGVTRPLDGNGDSLARCDIGAVEVQPDMLVNIDIKPGDSPNSINVQSRGVLSVAILSTSTFDATTVDPASVRFGPNDATSISSSQEDVNGDGVLDLVLHFRIQAIGLQANTTQACLTGQTQTSVLIHGCDTVRVLLGSMPSGLVLWNKLGSRDEVLNSEFGPDLGFYQLGDCQTPGCLSWTEVKGNPVYIPGVFGNALTLGEGPYFTYARVHNAVLRDSGKYLSAEKGAVEMWFQESADPVPWNYGIYRLFDGAYGLGKGVSLWVQTLDQYTPGLARLMFSLNGLCDVTSESDGQLGYEISAYNNTWIHVAAVWDRNGIAGTSKTMELFVDGAAVASATCTGWSTTFTGTVDIAGGNDTEIAGKFAVDNLKVWNYARTDYSDRFVEGFRGKRK